MNLWNLFPLLSGYEQIGNQVRLYIDWPIPEPNFTRCRGARTPLFRLYAEQDAKTILAWLAQNRAWQCLRVSPVYSREKGVRAVLLASDWHCGEASAMFRFARTRLIDSEAHRQRLQREIQLLIGSVLENPVRDGEFADLQLLEDVINVVSVGIELATPAEIVDAFFGSVG